jgi:ABC-2 type transport system ATP-binding protein
LETRGLTKHFGRIQAVEGLDLTVEASQVFGFLGPNGAGKSTTMRMIMGLIRPTRGEARLLGKSAATTASRAAGTVGALVEGPAFYGYLTARQNLVLLARLSGGASPAELDRALELAGLSADADRRVGAFSHGMKQRLGVASALLPRPRVLLLDEPTTGLDPQGRVEMRELLQRLNREEGVTIFLSSHLLGEVEQLCTHLAFLSHGRLLQAGPTAALLASETVRVELRATPQERAAVLLETRPEVQNLARHEDTLTFTCRQNALPALNAALVHADVEVGLLAPRPENLEELYLRLMRGAEHAGGA